MADFLRIEVVILLVGVVDVDIDVGVFDVEVVVEFSTVLGWSELVDPMFKALADFDLLFGFKYFLLFKSGLVEVGSSLVVVEGIGVDGGVLLGVRVVGVVGVDCDAPVLAVVAEGLSVINDLDLPGGLVVLLLLLEVVELTGKVTAPLFIFVFWSFSWISLILENELVFAVNIGGDDFDGYGLVIIALLVEGVGVVVVVVVVVVVWVGIGTVALLLSFIVTFLVAAAGVIVGDGTTALLPSFIVTFLVTAVVVVVGGGTLLPESIGAFFLWTTGESGAFSVGWLVVDINGGGGGTCFNRLCFTGIGFRDGESTLTSPVSLSIEVLVNDLFGGSGLTLAVVGLIVDGDVPFAAACNKAAFVTVGGAFVILVTLPGNGLASILPGRGG